MAKDESGLGSRMVVVGDPCSEFVRAVVRLAHEYEVEAVQCDDVYSAVVAAARANGRRLLVVGPIRELAREGSRFFQIAQMSSLQCCCLVDKGPAVRPWGLAAALRAGASIVGDANEVRPIIKDWLADGGRRVVRRSLRGLTDDDMRATEAELIALLGDGTEV